MIQVTLFAPIFLVLFVIACSGVRCWMIATGIAVFFQAAAPILVNGGGRVSGLISAYGLLPIGFVYLVLSKLKDGRSQRQPDASAFPVACLTLFTIIGVVGALLLPRIFEGQVRVMPPAYGLDTAFVERLHPSGRNYIQAVYLVCNASLFLISRWAIRTGAVSIATALNGMAVGATLSALTGLYQVIAYQRGWPWPSDVINSNTGVGQLYQQTVFGIQRMSATFLEPSLLGFHFVSAFALFGIGLRRRAVGGLLLLCLLISTSTSAYAGLLVLFPAAVLIYAKQGDGKSIFVLILFSIAVGSAFLIDQVWFRGAITNQFLTDKLSSSSGLARARTNLVAVSTLLDSWGFGAGVGSTRVSGLTMTLAATVGIPGLACLVAFLSSLIRACLKCADEVGRAFGVAILALAIVWVLSIPDLVMPYAWLLCGVACAYLSRSPSRAAAASEDSATAGLSFGGAVA